jgi:hypothetical protein
LPLGRPIAQWQQAIAVCYLLFGKQQLRLRCHKGSLPAITYLPWTRLMVSDQQLYASWRLPFGI